MNTGEDLRGMRKILDMSLWISLMLLILHFYDNCYAAFRQWRLTAPLSDRILENIGKPGVLKKSDTPKWIALALLIIFLLGVQGRKGEKFSYRGGLLFILSGLLPYFGSYLIFSLDADDSTITVFYIGVTLTGYLLVLTGGVRISRVISYSLRKDFFKKNNDGFQQEERLMETVFSLNLPARYQWQGKTRKSHINFINPRRGILIMGSPGSGKSWFIIEPMIHQLIQKGFALFIYDFKYNALTNQGYNQVLRYRDKYPPSA